MPSTSARPGVPEDAPPAVLFRLSYRTNEKHRSGFRKNDSLRDIVQSMRGWWELDPREVERLGIEHAWVGHGGKRVPSRLYLTITSYWPASPVGRPHDLLGKALQLLGEGLQPTIESVFAEADDDWLEHLRRKHRILPSFKGDMSPQDPYVALNLLISEWEAVSPLFSWTDRDLVETLVDDRNRWAHFDEEADAEIVLEAVGDIITLLKGVGADAEATRADSIRRALELQVDPLEVLEGA